MRTIIDWLLPLIIALVLMFLFGPAIGLFLTVLLAIIFVNLKIFGGGFKEEDNDEPPI